MLSVTEKHVDRVNRWGGLIERAWKVLDLVGVRGLLIGGVAVSFAGLASWAAYATPYVQNTAPLSYVITGALVVILIGPLIRSLGIRFDVQDRKLPRVDSWTGVSNATYFLCDDFMMEAYQDLRAKRKSQQEGYQAAVGSKLTDDMPMPALYQLSREETKWQSLVTKTDAEIAEQWRAMQRNVRHKLSNGDLVATGFRGGLTDHKQREQLIPSAHWRVLELGDDDVAASGDLKYTGVRIGQLASWLRSKRTSDGR